MTSTEIALLPSCPQGHGTMTLRKQTSPEQKWCGTWYDCTPGPVGQSCTSAVLLPSAALRNQLATTVPVGDKGEQHR